MRSMWKRVMYSVVAMLTATLVAGSVPAYAAEMGTLKIIPKVGNEEITTGYNGTFKVYKVADYETTGVFTKTDAFKDCDVTLTGDNLSKDETFRKITETITAFVKSHKDLKTALSGVGVNVEKPLEYGLYLICQDKSADGYTDTTPFLVMIPQYSENTTNVNAVAYPKISKVTTPPVTPPGGGDEGGDDGGDDNPPTPPKPPVTPPKEEEGEDEETPVEETPEQPGEDIGNMGEDGMLNEGEGGMMTDAGAMTGDNSQMTTYAAVAGVAAVALIGWVVWKKRSKKSN